MRLFKAIAWAALGLSLSMSLQACATPGRAKTPPPPLVVAKVLRETPPTDTLVCAQRPDGFGPAAWAEFPTEVRLKLIAWARILGDNADLHDRLVEYLKPGSCPAR
jgi:hypothetical protein